MPRILLIENSPAQVQDFTLFLEDGGFEVVTASDAKEGFARLAQGAVDMVLTDQFLPDESGIDLCQRIRAQPRYARLPVVLITNWPDPVNFLRALAAGIDGYLTKDHQPAEIVRRLRRISKRHLPPTEDHRGIHAQMVALSQQYQFSETQNRLFGVMAAAFEDVLRLGKRHKEELTKRKQAEEAMQKAQSELGQRIEDLSELDQRQGLQAGGPEAEVF